MIMTFKIIVDQMTHLMLDGIVRGTAPLTD
jgi:hypothetical protein